MKPIAHYMEQARLSVPQPAKATGLERKLVSAIVNGNYISSPAQRQLLSAAMGVVSRNSNVFSSRELRLRRANSVECQSLPIWMRRQPALDSTYSNSL